MLFCYALCSMYVPVSRLVVAAEHRHPGKISIFEKSVKTKVKEESGSGKIQEIIFCWC